LEEGLSRAGELGGEVEQVGGFAAVVEPFLEGVQAGPFPVWWTLVRFAVPDRVKGS